MTFDKVAAELLPRLTHPLALIAFAIYIVSFVLVKVILKAGVIKPVTQRHSFRLLNRILNFAGFAMILVILLGFAAYIYGEHLHGRLGFLNAISARRAIADLDAVAADVKKRGLSLRPDEKLFRLQHPIARIAELFPPAEAISVVIASYRRYGVPEITPALLLLSTEDELRDLLSRPFNYVPPSDSREAAYLDTYGWSLRDHDDEDGRIASLFEELRKTPNYTYRDFVLFLNAEWTDIRKDFPGGRFDDACLYLQLRSDVRAGRLQMALASLHEFESAYPRHRHLDDAYALATKAAQFNDERELAFELATSGETRGDGDMHPWLEEARFEILERWFDKPTLERYLDLHPKLRRDPLVLYTLAHHRAVDEDFDGAIRLFRELAETDFAATNRVDIAVDLSKVEMLKNLSEDRSPIGQFALAVAISQDEFVFYNQLHHGDRRSTWAHDLERRTPRRYFEAHNNFARAAALLLPLSKSVTDPILKQRVLYKLGRSYVHLSRSQAFFPTYWDDDEREIFRNKAGDAFYAGWQSAPTAPLADDCLVEAGVQWWNEKVLQRVVRDYPRANAADNALYYLGDMYEGRRDYVKANAAYLQMAALTPREHWKKEAALGIARMKAALTLARAR